MTKLLIMGFIALWIMGGQSFYMAVILNNKTNKIEHEPKYIFIMLFWPFMFIIGCVVVIYNRFRNHRISSMYQRMDHKR